jgi:ABC-type sugar transport system ATPase subunit
MIFVTHDIREAFLLGTRIGLMQEGRLAAIVKPEEFLKLELPEARGIRGVPPMRFLEFMWSDRSRNSSFERRACILVL